MGDERSCLIPKPHNYTEFWGEWGCFTPPEPSSTSSLLQPRPGGEWSMTSSLTHRPMYPHICLHLVPPPLQPHTIYPTNPLSPTSNPLPCRWPLSLADPTPHTFPLAVTEQRTPMLPRLLCISLSH
ncbi:hypothetical protein KIL84_020574 [Mauremys mutica]|uniref:Uncharacterized protein n=1 Tax=Mauremys mutica TaxID=74926 RepID=A0A9D3XZ30_9SAUR|nr:hypothetical protein KIL84_020574 [Mauremys mutica]